MYEAANSRLGKAARKTCGMHRCVWEVKLQIPESLPAVWSPMIGTGVSSCGDCAEATETSTSTSRIDGCRMLANHKERAQFDVSHRRDKEA